jgi:filamentous hemagglutinin family protein
MRAYKGIQKILGCIFLYLIGQSCYGNVGHSPAEVAVAPSSPPIVSKVDLSSPAPVSANLPQLSRVVHGSISTNRAADGKSMDINTGPCRNVGDFNSFNIGRGNIVNVRQASPSSQSIFRVMDKHPAQIRGEMNIDQGQVFLAGSGWRFHEGSMVKGDKLVVAAAHVSDASARQFFEGGNLRLDTIPGGLIDSRGLFKISDGGLLGLIGANIRQDGVIIGKKANVDFIAGDSVWVKFDDDLINFRVEGALEEASMEISRDALIGTGGGDITFTLAGMDKVIKDTINIEGYIAAGGSYIDQAGNVVFDAPGGSVKVEGTISSQARNKAGNITVTAKEIEFGRNTVINASADHVPGRIEIGGKREIIRTSAGPMGRPIAYAETVNISEGAQILAQRYKDGEAGYIFLIATGEMKFKGQANVENWGKGKGGFIELSQLSGEFSLKDINSEQILFKNYGTGDAGQFLLDPADLTISTSGGDIDISTIQTWLGLGNVVIETTNSLTVSNALTMSTGYDLVLISEAINLSGGITMSGYGNLVLWALSDSTTLAGSVTGSTTNFVALTRPTVAGPSLGDITVTNAIEFTFNRSVGGSAVELASGTHYTSAITGGTLPGGSALNIIGLVNGITGADARSSGIVEGTQVGTLDKNSIGLDAAETSALVSGPTDHNLIGYLTLTAGNIDGGVNNRIGGIVDATATGKTLFLSSLDYTAGSLTTTGNSIGAIAGYSPGIIRLLNSTITVTNNVTTGSYYGGGLVGENTGNFHVVNTAVNIGGVSVGGGTGGGLIGRVYTGGVHLINTAVSIGGVTCTSPTQGSIGGLFGLVRDTTDIIIEGLTGSIGNVTGANYYAGGLIGFLTLGSGVTFQGANSSLTSIGNISVSEEYAGGLVGAINNTKVASSTYFVIENTSLNIDSIGNISGKFAVGGLIAAIYGSQPISVAVPSYTGSLTIGSIGTISSSFVSGSYVAGLIGSIDSGIASVYNTQIGSIGPIIANSSGTNTNTAAGLIGFVSGGIVHLENIRIADLDASGANLITGSSTDTNITLGDKIILPNVKASMFSTDYLSWDTTGNDQSYGFISGQLTTLPSSVIPNANDVYFRFWKDNGGDPVTYFSQWKGKLGANLTSADAISINRATNGVLKLVYSGTGETSVPYSKVQIWDADAGEYDTYEFDTANPVVVGDTASSNFVINDAITTAITADPDAGATEIAPDSGAGYEFTEGTGWIGSIQISPDGTTLDVLNPEGRGFTYNGTSWQPGNVTVQTAPGVTTSTDPLAAGYSYNSATQSWYATIEDPSNVNTETPTTITTTTPHDSGFTFTGGAWQATVENSASPGSNTTTQSPIAEGFSYTGGSWKATVETSVNTNTAVTDPFTRGYVYDSGSSSWKASIEGGTTTTPLTEGFVYTGGAWQATVEDISSVGNTTTTETPGAEGFTYTGGFWQATVENSGSPGSNTTTQTPAAEGFTYNGSDWEATVETSAGTTAAVTNPFTRGYAYDSGSNSWKGSIEGGTTTTPLTQGFVYTGGAWQATVEDISNPGSNTTTQTPAAEGFTYNGSDWRATVETAVGTSASITNPFTRGYAYDSGSSSWKASIEGGTTTTPLTEGFSYNLSSGVWLAEVEGGTTATPGAEGYEFDAASRKWQAEVEPGMITRVPGSLGYTYIGGDWVAIVGSDRVSTPIKFGYNYRNGRWIAPKIDTSATAQALDIVVGTRNTKGTNRPETTVFNMRPENIETEQQAFEPVAPSKIQELDSLASDVDGDGTLDEAERITGIY